MSTAQRIGILVLAASAWHGHVDGQSLWGGSTRSEIIAALERTGARLDCDGDRVRDLELWNEKPPLVALARLRAFPELETLCLANDGRDEAELEVLRDLRNLRGLDLSAEFVGDRAMAWVGELTHLQSLRLARSAVTDVGLRYLAPLDELTSLDLSDTAVTDDGIRSLSGMRRLRSLRLDRTGVAGSTLACLPIDRIESLSLEACTLAPGALDVLGAARRLTSLSLLWARGLAEGNLAPLARCRRLRDLNLAFASIDVGALRALASSRTIERLDLRQTAIDDDAMDSVGAIVSLRCLDLTETAVTYAGVKRLLHVRPEITWLEVPSNWPVSDQIRLRRDFPQVNCGFGCGCGNPIPWHVRLAAERRVIEAITPLADAIDLGDADEVQRLIAEGAEVEQRSPAGRIDNEYGVDPHSDVDATPLYLACRRGERRIVELLLGAGADVHARRSDGTTALHAAAAAGDVELVNRLMRAGAELDAADDDGGAAIVTALEFGHVDVARALRAHGAAAPRGRAFGRVALHSIWSSDEGRLDAAFELGGSLADAGEEGHGTLREIGSSNRAPELAAKLLAHGADPNRSLSWGEAPLLRAIEHGDSDVARLLIGAGARVDVRTSQGETLPMIAAREGAEDVAALLIAHGASNEGLGVARFFRAVEAGDGEEMQRLVRAGVDVDGFDSSDRGASTDRRTPLIEAVCDSNDRAIVALLAVGADPNRVDDRLRSPLWFAIDAGDRRAVRRLLEHGAFADLVDEDGISLRDRARASEDHGIRRMVLRRRN